VKGYNTKYCTILENFGSILLKKRMFYPRNFQLSTKYTAALKEEVNRLKKEGMSESKIIEKLSKCIRFFC
jgi:hypothetical protein